MQKTFCDRCGAECVNYVVNLRASVRHTTNRGELLAEDYEGGVVQVCKPCKESLEKFLGRPLDIRSEAEMMERKMSGELELTMPARAEPR